MNGALRCWLQVLGDLLCYPNRMAFDIMPGGGKAPEPKGLLVVKVKAVTNIKGGGDLFSKVRTPPAGPAWAPLAHPSAFSRYQQQQAQSMITGGHGLSGQVHTGICASTKHASSLHGPSDTHFVPGAPGQPLCDKQCGTLPRPGLCCLRLPGPC